MKKRGLGRWAFTERTLSIELDSAPPPYENSRRVDQRTAAVATRDIARSAFRTPTGQLFACSDSHLRRDAVLKTFLFFSFGPSSRAVRPCEVGTRGFQVLRGTNSLLRFEVLFGSSPPFQSLLLPRASRSCAPPTRQTTTHREPGEKTDKSVIDTVLQLNRPVADHCSTTSCHSHPSLTAIVFCCRCRRKEQLRRTNKSAGL